MQGGDVDGIDDESLGSDPAGAGPTADRLYAVLVDRILDGRLRPGDALNELALAEDFGVSRTPVREAVQRLAMAGLAERGPRRSFRVRRLPPAELGDLLEALCEIEAVCARLSAARMSEVERRELEICVGEGARAAAGDGETYARLNVRFHQLLFDGARNDHLKEIAAQLRIRAAPYREAQFRQTDRIASSQDEHERILAAVLARDPAEAQAAMTRHVASSSLNIKRMLDLSTPKR
ncbi:MAG: GntR family transcriptional regulator [Phyllobacteriaceae bacterium]|nr:GntR family transcriptional regulator [Phyllobacteriaceae bacterium]